MDQRERERGRGGRKGETSNYSPTILIFAETSFLVFQSNLVGKKIILRRLTICVKFLKYSLLFIIRYKVCEPSEAENNSAFKDHNADDANRKSYYFPSSNHAATSSKCSKCGAWTNWSLKYSWLIRYLFGPPGVDVIKLLRAQPTVVSW